MAEDQNNIKGMQIKALIDERNARLKEILSPSVYMLNNGAQMIMQEIQELQNQCPHKYNEDGFCVYCYQMRGFC